MSDPATAPGVASEELPGGRGPLWYRCSHCGNKTRFDVVETVRRRSYHHFTVGGDLQIDEEEILDRRVESVTCRWCDRSDGIERLGLAAPAG